MQKLKEVFTPGSKREDTTTAPVAYDPSFDAARGTGTGYGTTGGYDTNTRYDTTHGTEKKGLGERIKEAIPGTAEHREKKHMQGELTTGERRQDRAYEHDVSRQSDRTDLGAGVYSPGMETTTGGIGGTSTGLGATDRELRREEMQEGMVCMPAGGAYREGDMEVRRQDPNITVEKFATPQGLEGEVITKTQQEVKIPQIPQETVEVCGTQTFTEVEDRPVVVERVVREVVHRPVEKQFEVTTRAIGETPLEKQVETLDINERVVDEVKGQKCPTSIPGYEGVQPHLETRPVMGGMGTAGYVERQSVGDKIESRIPGTDEHAMRKHAHGELTTGELATGRMHAAVTRAVGSDTLGRGLGTTSVGASSLSSSSVGDASLSSSGGALRREGGTEGMVCMPAGGTYREGDMEVRRQDPNITVEKFATPQGLEGEVITKTQQEVKIPEIPQETVEVCGTETLKEVEDRPMVVERVVREVVHRPVEKRFEVSVRAIGETQLPESVETLSITERIIDEYKGSKCPTSIAGFEGEPHLETRPVLGGRAAAGTAGVTALGGTTAAAEGSDRPSLVDRIQSYIPGTDEYAARKHGQGELTAGDKLRPAAQAPAGYEEPLTSTGRAI